MWFEQLAGFDEASVNDVASQFRVDGPFMESKATGRRMRHGQFEVVSLGELRDRAPISGSGGLRLSEVVANVSHLHTLPDSAGALFQVASQFNTLEMAAPSVTPEDGIDRYESDRTQGPACAIACGAGTIYRNYLVPVDGVVGQSKTRQIDCLADLAHGLGVEIAMENGYAFPTLAQLAAISQQVGDANEARRDELLSLLQIGMQWDTEVTIADTGHFVTQSYCSALPIAYTSHEPLLWEPFAQLVLDASYEATFRAACINAASTGNNQLYLTLIGGGVFGNDLRWILAAIQRSLTIFERADLDVRIVSHGSSNPYLSPLLV